jgi:hypothetical protein
MKRLEKFGQPRLWVSEHAMPVVGHDAHCVQYYAGLLCREREAVLDIVIGDTGWPKQELPLRAAAGDEVASARQDLSGQGHRRASVKARAEFRGAGLGRRPWSMLA